MDFSNHVQQPKDAGATASGSMLPKNSKNTGKDRSWGITPGWLRLTWILLLFAGTVILASVATLLAMGQSQNEKDYIDDGKFQAVFLDDGQVYFGKLKTITDDYIDMQGIYYLSTDQDVQPDQESSEDDSVTLKKLGCELHGPEDQMIINREHVSFWENLSDEGEISQTIAQWLDKNPDGLSCSDSTSQESDD